MRWPWLVRIFYQPEIEFDLLDDEGKPDHGKSVGFFAFIVLVTLMAVRILPASVGVVMVLIAAIFGQRVFVALIRSRAVTSAETVITDLRPEARPLDHPDE